MNDYALMVTALCFMVNFLIVLGANHLTGYPPGGLRAALAAALGGLQAGMCLIRGFSFLGGALWRIVFIVLMALIAFGMSGHALRRGVLFGLLRLAVEGITAGGGWAVILAAIVIFLLCFVGRKGNGSRYVPVTVSYGGRTEKIMALVDTGNTLRDPVTGRAVIVMDGEVGERLLALEPARLRDPIGTLAAGRVPGARLIPYSAVGMPCGLLLGVKAEEVRVDGKRADVIVAFAPDGIGHGKEFEALVGGTV